MLRRCHLILLALLTLPLTSCADVDLDPPTGHEDVVVRIVRSGGMGTVESFFVDSADLVVTGDGTGYRSGEDGIETFKVDAEELEDLLRQAGDAGLLDDAIEDRTAEDLMDASTTSIELDAGTVRRKHAVYGLGARDEYDDMADFVDDTLEWAESLPAEPYQPTAYRVLVHDANGYHCEVSEVLPVIAGDVVAQAILLPGDHCE